MQCYSKTLSILPTTGCICKLLLLFAAYCGIAKTNAQTTWPILFKQKIEGSFTQVYADNLLNIYTVNANNQVKKYNSKLDSVGVYNNLTKYGTISTIDVTNTLKILVYYKNFATINILDRFLKPVTTIDLRKQNIFQASVIALSYDGLIWVFDEVSYQLKKIDENGKVVLETPDCRLLFQQFKPPVKMIDTDGLLYLYEPSMGFLVFDYYGAFKQQISWLGWQQVSVANGWLSGIINGKLQSEQIKGLQSKQLLLPAFVDAQKPLIRINNHCINLQQNGVYIYTAPE